MATNTLNTRSSGQTILDTFFNDFNTAFNGDFVGRNSSGVPTSGQALGTVALPWGTINAATLVLNGSAVDTSKITSPVNRVVSGKVRTTSNQPSFITPNGAALSFLLAGATTNLVVDINGTSKTISTDITKSSLTAAPSSNNTCLSNDTDAAGQADTRLWGEPEHRKTMIVDTMGSSITALVGTFQSFKIGSEYFYAFVKSTTELTKCRRGYFYGSTLVPSNRSTFSNNDTITLMKTGYVFIDQDVATIDVSYTAPVYDFTAPSSPATGDYWYDLANKVWKRYDGASFVIINRTFIGLIVNDSTNCVAARCENFYAAFSDYNNIGLEVSTTEIISAKRLDGSVSVYGNLLNFEKSIPSWNITTNILTGTADMYVSGEQASTLYYLYIADNGKKIISDISPYYRDDFCGKYHPHNPWRCIGSFYNDGSSNIISASGERDKKNFKVYGGSGSSAFGSSSTKIRRYDVSGGILERTSAVIDADSSTLGGSFTITEPGEYKIGNSDGYTGGDTQIGISLNTSAPTTNIQSIGITELVNRATVVANGVNLSLGFVNLLIGDVIRGHNDGQQDYGTTDKRTQLYITKLNNTY